MPKSNPDRDMNEPVTLHGPGPEQVLRALLKVDPDAHPDTAEKGTGKSD